MHCHFDLKKSHFDYRNLLPDVAQLHSTCHNMSVVSFYICMFDKVMNDKEVSVKVTFMLFGNHCCHPLVFQGEHNSAIVNNKFGWVHHQHYTCNMGQASNWLVNQLQADPNPAICITLPRMTWFLIAAAYLLLAQQVYLTFDSWQFNLGPDRREVIGIIVHVLPCHCVHLFHHIIIIWLQELHLFA